MILAALVLVFTFAVLYSVSAAAGVLWRNPIVCVLAACAVWAAAFAVQTTFAVAEGFRRLASPAAITATGTGDLFFSEPSADTRRWDPEAGEDGRGGWVPAFYEAAELPGGVNSVYALLGRCGTRRTGGWWPSRRTGPRWTTGPITGDMRLRTAAADTDWVAQPGPRVPLGTSHLFLRKTAPRWRSARPASSARRPKAGRRKAAGCSAVAGPRRPHRQPVREAGRAGPRRGRREPVGRNRSPPGSTRGPGRWRSAPAPWLLVYPRDFLSPIEADLGTEQPALLTVADGRVFVAFEDGTSRAYRGGEVAVEEMGLTGGGRPRVLVTARAGSR